MIDLRRIRKGEIYTMARKRKMPIGKASPVEVLAPDEPEHGNHTISYCMRLLKTKGFGFALIALHLILGLFIVKDYGVSFDENY